MESGLTDNLSADADLIKQDGLDATGELDAMKNQFDEILQGFVSKKEGLMNQMTFQGENQE